MEIVLIRHGKPSSANNPIVNAIDYTKWVRQYNSSGVAKCSRPESINEQYKSFYTISSDLKRAIHSANIYLGKPPEKIDKLYREMEIPRYKISCQIKAWNWVYLSRFIWMLGFKGSFESFKHAKQRANIAALQLIEMANKQDKVLLFGHGYMNRYIRKSLIKKGWGLKSKSNAYWGITHLEI
jgi:broad specificity phosphatase PhoE